MGRFGSPSGSDPLASLLDREGASAIVEGPLAVVSPGVGVGDRPGTARTLCVIDGTVTNPAKLCSRLQRPPATPTATLIALGFERFGEGFLAELRGAFVILLWDRATRRGLLVRDQLGGRSLFHHERGRMLVFASEVQDLLALSPRTPPPDDVALARWLARLPAPPEVTLFRDLKRLRAGHLMPLRERALPRRWWTPCYRTPATRTPQEAASELRAEMTAAVDRALTGAAAPGVLLSGGFDSASIAALASTGLGAVPRTYSRVFPGHAEVDESMQIAKLRAHFSLPGVVEPFTGGSALAAAARFIDRWALPPVSPNWFVWESLVERAARERVDVLLDGEGGDELFGCSPAFLADLLRQGRFAALLSTSRAIPGMGAHPPPRWLLRAVRDYGIRGALPARVHGLARRIRGTARKEPSWIAASTRRLLADAERRYEWKELSGPRWWAGLVHALVDGPDALGAADQLHRESRMGGVSFVHPWRDLDLIEHVVAQPPELGFDPDLDRPLARAAMKGALPEAARLNTRKPYFNVLLRDALTGVDRRNVENLILDPPPELAPHLDLAQVRRLLGDSGGPGRILDLWQLATAAAWVRGLADPSALEPFMA